MRTRPSVQDNNWTLTFCPPAPMFLLLSASCRRCYKYTAIIVATSANLGLAAGPCAATTERLGHATYRHLRPAVARADLISSSCTTPCFISRSLSLCFLRRRDDVVLWHDTHKHSPQASAGLFPFHNPSPSLALSFLIVVRSRFVLQYSVHIRQQRASIRATLDAGSCMRTPDRQINQ
jgi:hypothetical protein